MTEDEGSTEWEEDPKIRGQILKKYEQLEPKEEEKKKKDKK
ncbi:MAG: hypothetical protein ACRD32_05830 [Nitrososphaerales archaeon]